MRSPKSWLLSVLFLSIFSLGLMANPAPVKPAQSVEKQIFNYLKGMKFEKADIVYVDFMVNDKAEIIVLSTSEKSLDVNLKSRLNYKKINAGNLDLMKKYTVPIRFKK